MIKGGIAADDSPESLFANKIADYLRAGGGRCFYAEVSLRSRNPVFVSPTMNASGISRVANYLYGYIHSGAIVYDPIPGIHQSCGQEIYESQTFSGKFIRTLATFATGGLQSVLLSEEEGQTLLRASEPTTDTLLKPADTTYQIPKEHLLHVTAGE